MAETVVVKQGEGIWILALIVGLWWFFHEKARGLNIFGQPSEEEETNNNTVLAGNGSYGTGWQTVGGSASAASSTSDVCCGGGCSGGAASLSVPTIPTPLQQPKRYSPIGEF